MSRANDLLFAERPQHTESLGVFRAVFARELRRSLGTLAGFMTQAVFPIVMLLSQVAAFSWIGNGADEYFSRRGFLLVLEAQAASAIFSSVILRKAIDDGFVDRLRAMPISLGTYLAARTAAQAIAGVAQCVVVIGVGLVLAPDVWITWRVALVLLVALPWGALWSLVGTFGALYFGRRSGFLQIAFFVLIPLLFVSTGFAPLDSFDSALQIWVRWQPLSAGSDALRYALLGGPLGDAALRSAFWISLLGTVLFGMSAKKLSARHS